MAFTAAGTQQGVELIRTDYLPGFQEQIWTNNEISRVFGAPTKQAGDTAVRWKLHIGANNSVQIFTEGQAAPDAGQQSYASAYVTWTYYRGVLQVTGHAKDAMQSNWVNGIELEATLLKQQLNDLVTTTKLSSANNGLLVAIDDSTTYGGVTRAAASWFCSKETAVNDTMSFSQLTTRLRQMRDADYAANTSVILASYTQLQKGYNITGMPFMRNGAADQIAPNYLAPLPIGGALMVPIRDLSSSTLLYLDLSEGKWAHRYIRDWQVDYRGRSADSDVYDLTYGDALVCLDPYRQAKDTGLST